MTAGDDRTSEAGPPHVLVIDDAPEILDLFVELLESEGYRVTTSREILTLDDIWAIDPDVIVHDLILSGNDDDVWQMLSQTRHDPRLAQVPLILCTADARVMHDRPVAAKLENLDVPVILKPFAIEALLKALTDVLDRPAPNLKRHLGSSLPPLSLGVRPVVDWCRS